MDKLADVEQEFYWRYLFDIVFGGGDLLLYYDFGNRILGAHLNFVSDFAYLGSN